MRRASRFKAVAFWGLLGAGCGGSTDERPATLDAGSIDRGPACGQPKAVYGPDTRVEVEDFGRETFQTPIRATAMLLPTNEISVGAMGPTLSRRTLRERVNLCAAELFACQPAPGSCTAVLIDPQTVVTANHCVPSPAKCAETTIVFDYAYQNDDLPELSADDIYRCARVLNGSVTTEERADAGAGPKAPDADYSLLTLDRPVVGRKPATLTSQLAPKAGAATWLIGHPLGVPMKIDTDGAWLQPMAGSETLWEARLDAFAGNSGSGLFDAEGQLEALLIGGRVDFAAQTGTCLYVNTEPQKPIRGEVALPLSALVEGFCAGMPTHSICQGATRTP